MSSNRLYKTIDDKLNEGRSYRRTQEFRVLDPEPERNSMRVEGYATTFNDPYELFAYANWEGYRVTVMEQIDPEAFSGCDMEDAIMQYDHVGRVFARISNGTLTLRTDDHGLKVEADLGGTTLGRQLYEEISGGYTNRMSFGFTIEADKRTEERDEENKTITILRTITKIKRLWDVSAVSIPANDATEISARSFADGVIAELQQELLEADKIKQRKQKIRILTEV